MRAKLLAILVNTFATVFLTACFPSVLTSRPEAQIIVTDETGVPLEGATVTLGTMEWHGITGQNTKQDFVTDREGKVEFHEQHAVAMQVLLPDGDVRYTWSLCFSKPGFASIPLLGMNFDEPIKIAMYPSDVNSGSSGFWMRKFARQWTPARGSRASRCIPGPSTAFNTRPAATTRVGTASS